MSFPYPEFRVEVFRVDGLWLGASNNASHWLEYEGEIATGWEEMYFVSDEYLPKTCANAVVMCNES
jgi:hypothetical protein